MIEHSDLINIDQKVNRLVNEYPKFDPYEIAKKRFIITEQELPKQIDGMITQVENEDVLILNKNLNEIEKTIVVTKQIGNDLLHESPATKKIMINCSNHKETVQSELFVASVFSRYMPPILLKRVKEEYRLPFDIVEKYRSNQTAI
ncbi:hypothetical protein M3202_21575 [Alkalihalobacillus oceani]|uniref:Uncharacterized protein n=1 Tax=Halalkalibacter oceani TaxID=1653776 RepID=A0A9X2DT40_9BACI|nr:hypothetical protein [Halalkalibacter oceani]MCM3716636.1 hypothetical protein [Halalkalibacter oceani]